MMSDHAQEGTGDYHYGDYQELVELVIIILVMYIMIMHRREHHHTEA